MDHLDEVSGAGGTLGRNRGGLDATRGPEARASDGLKIKRYSSLFSAYRQLAISMKMVADEIGETGGIPRETEREIDRIRARYRTLSVDDDPGPSPKLVERLQAEVNRRVPTSALFYPSINLSPRAPPAAPAPPSIAGDIDGVDTKIDLIEPWPRGNEESR